MKTIIAGSRDFTDYEFLKSSLQPFVDIITEVISGTARGADQLGEQWATEFNKKIIRMPANWNQFGKSAGYIRNQAMAQVADLCIVFWDGKSKGTKHMIDIATKDKKDLHIFRY